MMELAQDRTPTLNPTSTDWFAWLPAEEQATCRREFTSLLASGLRPGQLDYDALWWGWCSTAEIHTDPALLARLSEHSSLEEGLPLPRPGLD